MIKHPSSRQAFTLVELLMVMAIISILTSLAVLGFRGLTGSTVLTSASDQVNSLISFARQEAVAKDTTSALVLATTSNVGSAAYRAFSVWEYVASPDGGTTPATWVQASRWQLLPQGTIVDNTGGVSTFLPSTSVPTSFPSTLNYQGTTLNPSTDCAIYVFLPSGRLLPSTSSNPFELQLVEGFYNGTTATYQHTSPTNSTLPANYVDYIFSTATGEPKIVRP